MTDKGKIIELRFERKNNHKPRNNLEDVFMVRKYMEYRNSGLLYETLFPVGCKNHPDIYYDFDSYMWRVLLPNGELQQGDIRSMVSSFIGEDIAYHYEIEGKEKCARFFEIVVRDAVENPESFSIQQYIEDYSTQEWKYLSVLSEKLLLYRNGERYTGAKLLQWIKE